MILFMMTRDHTAGAIYCSDEECEKLAKLSLAENKQNPTFVWLFTKHLDRITSEKPDLSEEVKEEI